MNVVALFVTISLAAIIVMVGGNSVFIMPSIYAQDSNLSSASSSQSQNTTTTTDTGAAEEKTYILIFGQRTIGNIDNSTKIVSSIVGNNSAKIQKSFWKRLVWHHPNS